jgi:hypothetical protein
LGDQVNFCAIQIGFEVPLGLAKSSKQHRLINMSDKKFNFTGNFESARVGTIKSVMSASGWNAEILDQKAASEDSIYFYVTSHPTNWTWMCSIPKEMFFKLIGQTANLSVSDAAGFLGATIDKGSSGTVGANEKEEFENSLGIALSAYFSKTGTYRQTADTKNGSHFFVIMYSKSMNIRPFAVGGESRFPLTVDKVTDYVGRVIASDSIAHPEWVM